MKILRTYLLMEFAGPLFLSVGVLSFLMVIVSNLQKVVDLIINKGVDILSVFTLFLLMMPYIITYALPIAVLIAVLVALGRLSSDNEIIAIRASGISLLKLVLPLLTCGAIISLALVIFNDRAASYAHYAYRKTLMEIGIKNPTAALEEGVFINSFQKYVLFIYRVDQKHNKLGNIRIYEPQGNNKPTRTIVAKSGEFISVPERNALKLKLIDGTSDEPDPDNPTHFYKLNFKTYFINMSLTDAQNKGDIDKKPRDMSIPELKKEVIKLKRQNIDPSPILTEMHEKVALGFSAFIFVLIGSPLGIITRRREKSINIGIALLIIMVYYPFLIGCKALGIQGVVPPGLAMWIPNIIFGIIGSFLTFRLCVS